MANPHGRPTIHHFTPEQIAELAEQHRQGVPSNHLAESYGCSGQTITRLLKVHGLWDGSQHHRSRYKADQKQQMVERYLAGESMRAIADDNGCTQANVGYILRKRGVPIRRPGRPDIPEETLALIRRRREAGVSHQRIADELGVTEAHVMATCRRMGLPGDPRMSGPAHHAWKGGRSIDGNGYVQAWIPSDDPMAEMATGTGRVPEHRLVMARALGRPLRKDETVHHLDGDQTHNEIGNLQLRQGKHGKGIVMTCNACGSHDIRPTEIADPAP